MTIDALEYMTNSSYFGVKLIGGFRRINLARRLAETDELEGLMRGLEFNCRYGEDKRSREKAKRKMDNLTMD